MELKSNQKIDKLIELRSKIKVHEKLCHFSDILDDKFVNGFLEGKKYDVHETIFCLENYIELRTVKYRKLIQPFLPSRASLLGTEFVNFLSSRDHHGRHVAVFNISAWNPSLVSLQEVVVTGLFIFDEAIRRYVATSDEFVLIANYGGVSFEQAKVITPRLAFQVLELYLKCLPGRQKRRISYMKTL
ncbi:retinaldehyde-binding protein 1 isoform X1 [Folsomia candida]|uniref:retinaldehyde-binding protein 1 isoform X1 n=1 Tax=Folsomia candida TaxID=158441 RepID=UPI000B90072D|nr:retinaldehyde-binding protein 1 isoform X1 [Folsomia candida]XP_035707697.1 retinaldehyde-binding protein 1 isoform X1 [Folsomia candida]